MTTSTSHEPLFPQHTQHHQQHSHAEVNLRRLLARFEASIARPRKSNGNGVDDLEVDTIVSAERKHYSNLAHLHKLLTAVETDPARKKDDTVLCSYRQRVEQLEAVLDKSRLISSVGRTVASLRKLSASASAQDNAERVAAAERVLKLQREAEDELRAELLDNTRKANTPTVNGNGNGAKTPPLSTGTGDESSVLNDTREELLSTPNKLRHRGPNIPPPPTDTFSTPPTPHLTPSKPPPPSKRPTKTASHDDSDSFILSATDAKVKLDRDRKEQQQMTEDMLVMSQQLRMNAGEFGDRLKRDAVIMNEATHLLDTNLSTLTTASARLDTLNKTARTTTWMVWATVLVVCLVFVGTVGVMRVFGKREGGARRFVAPTVGAAVGGELKLLEEGEDGWFW
ncbi:vesicle transport protein [Fimicolochytrium jonesii]|uniref:vesicle transport protein n=1 Tax=Fimicolochytrium jonesii TaxID=1396493 RepID=UPI0022FE3CE2|nr:vesicle transport protein [Fimicolochytrium jonesii]KAI8826831.1 vesicle transport protein [Fimicolochytrium jonesii]